MISLLNPLRLFSLSTFFPGVWFFSIPGEESPLLLFSFASAPPPNLIQFAVSSFYPFPPLFAALPRRGSFPWFFPDPFRGAKAVSVSFSGTYRNLKHSPLLTLGVVFFLKDEGAFLWDSCFLDGFFSLWFLSFPSLLIWVCVSRCFPFSFPSAIFFLEEFFHRFFFFF